MTSAITPHASVLSSAACIQNAVSSSSSAAASAPRGSVRSHCSVVTPERARRKDAELFDLGGVGEAAFSLRREEFVVLPLALCPPLKVDKKKKERKLQQSTKHEEIVQPDGGIGDWSASGNRWSRSLPGTKCVTSLLSNLLSNSEQRFNCVKCDFANVF